MVLISHYDQQCSSWIMKQVLYVKIQVLFNKFFKLIFQFLIM